MNRPYNPLYTVPNRRKRSRAATLLTIFSMVLLSQNGLAAADDTPMVDWGRDLYMSFCVSCHGWTGKGDGPAAPALKAAPADLTQISQRNGGKFPSTKVKRYIDGDQPIQAHGSRQMRVWGKVLSRESSGDNETRLQILALTKFIESIQEKEE